MENAACPVWQHADLQFDLYFGRLARPPLMLLRYPSANDISRSIVSGARSPMETTYRVGAYDIGWTAQSARALNKRAAVHCLRNTVASPEEGQPGGGLSDADL